MKKAEVHYNIELNNRQARIVRNACEQYMRLRMGKMTGLAEDLAQEGRGVLDGGEFDVFAKRYEETLSHLEDAVRTAWPCGCVGRVSEDAYIAGDIYGALRNKMAWTENPQGGTDMSFATPYQVGSEPMPKCTADAGSLEDKHWRECWMISQYEKENKQLKEELAALKKLLGIRNGVIIKLKITDK